MAILLVPKKQRFKRKNRAEDRESRRKRLSDPGAIRRSAPLPKDSTMAWPTKPIEESVEKTSARRLSFRGAHQSSPSRKAITWPRHWGMPKLNAEAWPPLVFCKTRMREPNARRMEAV